MKQTPQFAGIQVISDAAAIQSIDLGPLAQLVGTWTSPQSPAQGWNVIAVPGPGGSGGTFILEVIPYMERLTFSPVVVAMNRGRFSGGTEAVQNIAGLMYEQVITSVCETPFCAQRGFSSGTQIHAETGLFLYLQNGADQNANIARLATIPHGNAVLALGSASTQNTNIGNDFIPDISAIPFPEPGFDYDQQYQQNTPPIFENFNKINPNNFLQKTISSQSFTALTTINMSTANNGGGILNVPFVTQNTNATNMTASFWIETLSDGSLQLQYSQNITLQFPPTGNAMMVSWPHITINTLVPAVL